MAERFWAGVQPAGDNDCWLWIRSTVNGYGQTTINAKQLKAHRVAFRLANGHWPNQTLHKCDNSICCNPRHLVDGTHQMNTDDMLQKGRHWVPKGSASPHAKLNEAQVLAIRAEYAAGGTSYTKLAKKYSCCFQLIAQIVKRLIWTHV